MLGGHHWDDFRGANHLCVFVAGSMSLPSLAFSRRRMHCLFGDTMAPPATSKRRVIGSIPNEPQSRGQTSQCYVKLYAICIWYYSSWPSTAGIETCARSIFSHLVQRLAAFNASRTSTKLPPRTSISGIFPLLDFAPS